MLNPFYLSMRLRLSDAGLEPPDNAQPVIAARVVWAVVRQRERHPQHHARIRELESARHHADDGVNLTIELDGLSIQHGRRAEPSLPQAAAQDHHAMLAVLFFLMDEGAALRRINAQGREKISRRHRAEDPLRRFIT